MRKRTWKVQWRACPRPDSHERLVRAVRLLLDHAAPAPSERAPERPAGADDPRAAGQAAKE